jgi:hypothetical protein
MPRQLEVESMANGDLESLMGIVSELKTRVEKLVIWN